MEIFPIILLDLSIWMAEEGWIEPKLSPSIAVVEADSLAVASSLAPIPLCPQTWMVVELYGKSLPKLQFVYLKRKVSTKLFYAPK